MDRIRIRQDQQESTANSILALAHSNYEVKYTPDQNLSERIIFPATPAESNGALLECEILKLKIIST